MASDEVLDDLRRQASDLGLPWFFDTYSRLFTTVRDADGDVEFVAQVEVSGGDTATQRGRQHAEFIEAVTEALPTLLQAAERLSRAEALLRELTEHPPTFRDYSGTDEDTCGYCHEPLEGYEGRAKGEHHPDCKWAKARAFLAGAGRARGAT